jgi:hypothetical protein
LDVAGLPAIEVVRDFQGTLSFAVQLGDRGSDFGASKLDLRDDV